MVKKGVSVSIALALVLSVTPAMAASRESIGDQGPATFRALSKLPTGERAVSPSLTDDQLASVEGEGSWSNRVVIEQMREGGGTNIAIVKQQNGKRAVVKKRIGGNSTIEAVRVLALSCVPLLNPLTSRVGSIMENVQ
jgi:uncharacterized protein YlzI (FlbEa/FlbD family)